MNLLGNISISAATLEMGSLSHSSRQIILSPNQLNLSVCEMLLSVLSTDV